VNLPVNPATGNKGFGGAQSLPEGFTGGQSGDEYVNRGAVVNDPFYGNEVNRSNVTFDTNPVSRMAGPIFSSLLLGGLGAMYGLPAGFSAAMGGMNQLQNIANGGSINPLAIASTIARFIPGLSGIAPYIGGANTLAGLVRSGGKNPMQDISSGISLARLAGNSGLGGGPTGE